MYVTLVHIYIHAYTYVFIYIHTYRHIHTYIYMHTHTHTNTHTNTHTHWQQQADMHTLIYTNKGARSTCLHHKHMNETYYIYKKGREKDPPFCIWQDGRTYLNRLLNIFLFFYFLYGGGPARRESLPFSESPVKSCAADAVPFFFPCPLSPIRLPVLPSSYSA